MNILQIFKICHVNFPIIKTFTAESKVVIARFILLARFILYGGLFRDAANWPCKKWTDFCPYHYCDHDMGPSFSIIAILQQAVINVSTMQSQQTERYSCDHCPTDYSRPSRLRITWERDFLLRIPGDKATFTPSRGNIRKISVWVQTWEYLQDVWWLIQLPRVDVVNTMAFRIIETWYLGQSSHEGFSRLWALPHQLMAWQLRQGSLPLPIGLLFEMHPKQSKHWKLESQGRARARLGGGSRASDDQQSSHGSFEEMIAP